MAAAFLFTIGLNPHPSVAAPIPANVQFTQLATERADADIRARIESEDLFVPLVGSDVAERARRKFLGTNGWSCLAPHFANRGPVQIELSADVAGNRYFLGVDLGVDLGGGKLRHALKTVFVQDLVLDELEAELGAAYEPLLNQAVDELDGRRVKPCAPTVKARGQTRINSQGVTWEGSYEGEAQLALDDAGAFSGSMPLAYTWSPIVVSAPGAGTMMCTVSGTSQSTADVAGAFDEDDGALKFTRLAPGGVSGTLTSTCVYDGESVTASGVVPSVPRTDAAGQADLRIALEDGAQRTWDVPSGDPGISLQFTLQLRYDDAEAPAVSEVPGLNEPGLAEVQGQPDRWS